MLFLDFLIFLRLPLFIPLRGSVLAHGPWGLPGHPSPVYGQAHWLSNRRSASSKSSRSAIYRLPTRGYARLLPPAVQNAAAR